MAIQSLTLKHYKAFERMSVSFTGQTILVGPNNAGKSTIIGALRVAAQMIKIAQRTKATATAHDGGIAWNFSAAQVSLSEENLRHEFRNEETTLEVKFQGGSRISATWPTVKDNDEGLDPYFIVWNENSVRIRTAREARRSLPAISIIPTLRPVEQEEAALSDVHVKSNTGSRLASTHFRNQLRLLQETPGSSEDHNELDEFLKWAEPWTPDFKVGELTPRMTERGRQLDLFCKEKESRTDKELFWAGDGIQVWLQLLYHVYRARDSDCIILDEPDLYLHADLQRRLVRLLETIGAQSIAASHSTELLAESTPKAVVWVDKRRRRAISAPSEEKLTELTRAIGSHFNLRLARALRAEGVLFVEGNDMRILRNIGKTLGASELTREVGLVTIPLGGFSRWSQVEPFTWLTKELLDSSVRVMVLLDRDYRGDSEIGEIEKRLGDLGVSSHVWRRKELESYLLEPATLARLTKKPVDEIDQLLGSLANDEKQEVFSQRLAERVRTDRSENNHLVNVATAFQHEFDQLWSDEPLRHHWCNAKNILSGLNRELALRGCPTVSARKISSSMRATEVPAEMRSVIEQAEAMIVRH